MKKNVFKLMCLASIAWSLAACQNSVDNVNDPIAEEGDPTYMALSLSFPATQTRTEHDGNATADEVKIETVDVFVYSDNRVQAYHKTLPVSEFDYDSSTDKYTTKELIQTTAGLKYVFVGVNFPAALVSELDGESASQRLADVGRALDIDALKGGGDAFIMCNKTLAQNTLVATASDVTFATLPGSNKFDIVVTRLASKVSMQEKSGISYDINEGSFTGLEFALDHINGKSFLLQGSDPNYADPNWTHAGWTDNAEGAEATDVPGPESVVNSGYWDDLVKKTPNGDYKAVVAAGTTPNVHYLAENTSQPAALLKGTLTRLIVRTKFLPKEVYIADGSNTTIAPVGYAKVTSASQSITAPQTFYLVTDNNGFHYYTFDNSLVSGLKTAVEGTVDPLTYTDGYCYYDLWFNSEEASGNTTQFQSLRNQYYNYTISGFKMLGDNTEALDDPDEPMFEPDTKIAVTLSIEDWELKSKEFTLGEEKQ
ncbi:MAG: Mfa1 family fimbria major subunit [Mediterranea sp.]|nr:Mfa1 family fimbria major subunit [Mediterranea sp.]